MQVWFSDNCGHLGNGRRCDVRYSSAYSAAAAASCCFARVAVDMGFTQFMHFGIPTFWDPPEDFLYGANPTYHDCHTTTIEPRGSPQNGGLLTPVQAARPAERRTARAHRNRATDAANATTPRESATARAGSRARHVRRRAPRSVEVTAHAFPTWLVQPCATVSLAGAVSGA